MICPKEFLSEVKKCTSLMTGVPDSALKGLSDYLEFQDIIEHVKVPSEGISISYSAGYYMATKKPGLIYLQNSGFGNLINPLTSLVDNLVYSIPCVILVGWRGYKGTKDEPQHKKMGLVTHEMVDAMGYNSIELNAESDWKKCLTDSFQLAVASKSPVFLLVEPKLFKEIKVEPKPDNNFEPRELVLSKLYNNLEDHTIVSTTGKSSRELYEINSNVKDDIFYCVGSMGHASTIALSLSKYLKNKVACIDGDGAFLMHMGFVSMINDHQAENFNHIVINNGLHESVGNQTTLYENIDVVKIAEASGYKNIVSLDCEKGSMNKVINKVKIILDKPGPNLIELNVGVKTRSELSRPKETPKENLEKFMNEISK
jgi:phosphonopyruvate decarboxylase